MEPFWKEDVTLPSFSPLSHDIHTEVLVIGGGLTGLLCAARLRDAGVSVMLVESDRLASGVTGRTTAKITVQHGAVYQHIAKRYGTSVAAEYYAANRAALEDYRRLFADADCGFKTCDGFLYTRYDHETLVREKAALTAIGAPVEWSDDVELPFPIAGALRIPHQAQIHPMKLIRHLAQGFPIFEKTRVREIRGCTVTTDQGASITADAVIVATHFPFLNRHGLYPVKLYQHRSYVVSVQNAPPMQHMYWDCADTGLTFRQCGNRLLIVGGGHRTGTRSVGWKAAEQVVRRYYRDATITDRWATQDCMSLDGIPYIGRYGKHTPHVFAATGFNGWGMTSAMVAALLLTGELTGEPMPWASVFAPDRTVFHRQLLTNLSESVKHILTPTVPRCPHLGCALKWNAVEHSWDCACHGSRFSEDGRLRNGPATDSLKRKRE